MSSSQYYAFISDSLKKLPEKDRQRMEELWTGFEQVVAAAYQKFVEASFNASVKNQFAFSDQRWLSYEFNNSNIVNKPAVFKSNQGLSLGINLTAKYLIKVAWDDHVPIELDLRGFNPANTLLSEIITITNSAVGFNFASADSSNSLLVFTSPTSDVNSKIKFYVPALASANASELILGLLATDLPLIVPDFPYIYSSPYPNLYSVPVLEDAIRPESVQTSLQENVDYKIVSDLFYFKTQPLPLFWAKRSLFNEEWPWNNFGFLLDIYQPNSLRYIQVIQGLWFAFWTGPKPQNLKRALYLLFQLPVSPFDGVVTRITLTEIDVTSDTGVTDTQTIPIDLDLIVTLGQRVETFDPLVSGIDIFDKVNKPGFIADEIGRYGIQRFLLDEASRGSGPDTDETKALSMLEEYTFLPQISVNAFASPDINIGSMRVFLDAIKPIIKTYLFQVIIGIFKDEIDAGDSVGWLLDIDLTPSVDFNETTLQPSSVLDSHEVSPNPGLSVDSEGSLLEEMVEVEVSTFGLPLDSF